METKAVAKNDASGKVCNVCGDIGYFELIATCTRCNETSQHIYCMQQILHMVPDIWHCEECKMIPDAAHDENVHLVVLDGEAKGDADQDGNLHLMVFDEEVKDDAAHARYVCDKDIESKSVDLKLMPIANENWNMDTERTEGPQKTGLKETDRPHGMFTISEDIYQHFSTPCWKGTFEVLDIASHMYSGIQARLPPQISRKAYEFSKKMPELLTFRFLPRLGAWPHIFRIDPPTENDIGLYFFPCGNEKSKEKYIRLLKRIDSYDLAMGTHVAEVELLIFASKLLTKDAQRTATGAFLWGMFRRVNCKKFSNQDILASYGPSSTTRINNYIRELDPLSGASSGENHMKIDMVGNTEVDKTGKRITRVGTRAFAIPISEEPTRRWNMSAKFPVEKVASPALPEIPPGFSRYAGPIHGNVCPMSHPSGSLISRKNIMNYDEGLSALYGASSGESEMEIDMVGGTEVGKIDKPIPRIDICAFAAPISEEPAHRTSPASPVIPPGFFGYADSVQGNIPVKFPVEMVASPAAPVIPPGFPRYVGSAHGNVSVIFPGEKVSSPAVPVIPPGFPRSAGSVHGNVSAKFPLEKVASPTLPVIPPGFSGYAGSIHENACPMIAPNRSLISKENSTSSSTSYFKNHLMRASEAHPLQSNFHQVGEHLHRPAKGSGSTCLSPSVNNGESSFIYMPNSTKKEDMHPIYH